MVGPSTPVALVRQGKPEDLFCIWAELARPTARHRKPRSLLYGCLPPGRRRAFNIGGMAMRSQSDDAQALGYANPKDLRDIPFPSETGIQPAWIGEHHPQYVEDHGMERELSSVRIAQHGGHQIRITTTYRIEIDGSPVHLHLQVGNDGQLHCHTTPYANYVSAIDLVTALVDRFPEAFKNLGNRGSGGDHGSAGDHSSWGDHDRDSA